MYHPANDSFKYSLTVQFAMTCSGFRKPTEKVARKRRSVAFSNHPLPSQLVCPWPDFPESLPQKHYVHANPHDD